MLTHNHTKTKYTVCLYQKSFPPKLSNTHALLSSDMTKIMKLDPNIWTLLDCALESALATVCDLCL
jgi:hypothetical protein